VPGELLPTFELWPVGNDRYEAFYAGFTVCGTFNVSVVATDVTGAVSLPAATTVVRQNPTGADAYEDDDVLLRASWIGLDAANPQRHDFHDAGDEDWTVFHAIAGQEVTTETLNLEANVDTYLELYRSTGELVASNDNRLLDVSSYIRWEVDVTGLYYIRVTDAQGGYGTCTGYSLKAWRHTAPGVPATLTVTVLAAGGGAIPHATVVLTCVSPSWLHVQQTDGGGSFSFSGLAAGTYQLEAVAPGYVASQGSATLLEGSSVNRTVTLTQANTGGGRKSAAKFLEMDVREDAFPLTTDDRDGVAIVESGPLALRLSSDEAIDPESVWAYLESGNWSAEGGQWRVTDPNDGRDGWVVFVPEGPLPSGGPVTMVASALTVRGEEVGPAVKEFWVEQNASGAYDGAGQQVVEETGIEPLPEILAASVSPVYRLGPPGVFMEAVVVQIPVPAGMDPAELGVWYFSESARHCGWYPGDRVQGWIAPESLGVVEEDGELYVQFEVNHSGVMQLGRRIPVNVGGVVSFDIGTGGSRAKWMLFGAVVVALGAAFAVYSFKPSKV
jgi:hypothetical protein